MSNNIRLKTQNDFPNRLNKCEQKNLEVGSHPLLQGSKVRSNGKPEYIYRDPRSGGDAERIMYQPKSTMHDGPDPAPKYAPFETSYLKELEAISKSPDLSASNSNTSSHVQCKKQPNVDDIGSLLSIYENDDYLGVLSNCSGESTESKHSFKTVVSRKRSHDLRKLVLSQYNAYEIFNEAIRKINNTDTETQLENNCSTLHGDGSIKYPVALRQCKRCANHVDKVDKVISKKDATTEISKYGFSDGRYATTLTLSLGDLINSKVISPMIQKLHRISLTNLKEEISLMEDLERIPNKVNNLYKSILFKQNDQ